MNLGAGGGAGERWGTLKGMGPRGLTRGTPRPPWGGGKACDGAGGRAALACGGGGGPGLEVPNICNAPQQLIVYRAMARSQRWCIIASSGIVLTPLHRGKYNKLVI